MAVTDASSHADDFAAKWRMRWPEWETAQVFVRAAQREVAVAWFALLQELADAAWSGSERAPGLAKLAWWQEELRGWAKGARRHPLAAVLQPLAVDWSAFATSLSGLRSREALQSPPSSWCTAYAGFAEGIAMVEARLWPASHPPTRIDTLGPLLIDAADTDAARADLATQWRSQPTGARARRLWSALARERLQSRRMSRWRTLLLAWRTARN